MGPPKEAHPSPLPCGPHCGPHTQARPRVQKARATARRPSPLNDAHVKEGPLHWQL